MSLIIKITDNMPSAPCGNLKLNLFSFELKDMIIAYFKDNSISEAMSSRFNILTAASCSRAALGIP